MYIKLNLPIQKMIYNSLMHQQIVNIEKNLSTPIDSFEKLIRLVFTEFSTFKRH